MPPGLPEVYDCWLPYHLEALHPLGAADYRDVQTAVFGVHSPALLRAFAVRDCVVFRARLRLSSWASEPPFPPSGFSRVCAPEQNFRHPQAAHSISLRQFLADDINKSSCLRSLPQVQSLSIPIHEKRARVPQKMHACKKLYTFAGRPVESGKIQKSVFKFVTL